MDKEEYKKYLKRYIAQRMEDFRKQYDHERSWRNLQDLLRKRKRRRVALYCAVALTTVLLLVVGFGYTAKSYKPSENPVRMASAPDISFPENGEKRATLTLDNGEKIDLSAQSGEIRSGGQAVADNSSDRTLVYKKAATPSAVVQYNTLSVPRGGEYQLVLSDGTKVWMNAESTLRYPTVFAEPKREVYLNGEALFEVAKDREHPFLVRTLCQQVEVLGTRFNVSAYPGNKTYTTLVEGCVRVGTESDSVMLKPNQQAVTAAGCSKITTHNVPARLYTSWAEGNYELCNTSLADIVAQLSRWYDVEMCFRSEPLKHKRFSGVIFRHEELGFAVDVIEEVSDVRFRREGDVIYIEDGRVNREKKDF